MAMASTTAPCLLGATSCSPRALTSAASTSNGAEYRCGGRGASFVPSSSASHSFCRTVAHCGLCSSSWTFGGLKECCRAGAVSTATRSGGLPGPLTASLRREHAGWGAGSGGFLSLNSVTRRLPAEKKNRVVPRKVALRVAAEGTDVTKVAGTLFKLGRDGLDAGAKLIPESVPRPLAQAVVGVAATAVLSWLLRSVFSTLTFVLAVGALSLGAFVLLTKTVSDTVDSKDTDKKPEDGDNVLESARKIMDKYKL